MILREYVLNNIGKTAKIGFGTCFMFCSKITANTPRLFEKWCKKSHARRVKNLASMKEQIKDWEKYWNKKEKRLLDRFRKDAEAELVAAKKNHREPVIEITEEEYIAQLKERREKEYQSLRDSIEYEDAYLSNYTDYLDREIEEIYGSFTENAEIVCVKGDEIGKYWDVKEYEKDHTIIINGKKVVAA